MVKFDSLAGMENVCSSFAVELPCVVTAEIGWSATSCGTSALASTPPNVTVKTVPETPTDAVIETVPPLGNALF